MWVSCVYLNIHTFWNFCSMYNAVWHCAYSTGSVTISKAGPCNVNTHCCTKLHGRVLKMAAWQGFDWLRFFSHLRNTHAKAKFIIAHLFGCSGVSHTFQIECICEQKFHFDIQDNIVSQCAIRLVACFQYGCVQFHRAVRLRHMAT